MSSCHANVGVSENWGGPPKSSISIGFSIIFTIHFGGFPAIFGSTHVFLQVRASDDGWFSPVGACRFLLPGRRAPPTASSTPSISPGEALESQAKRRGGRKLENGHPWPNLEPKLPVGCRWNLRPCIKFLMSRVLMPDPFQAQHVAS